MYYTQRYDVILLKKLCLSNEFRLYSTLTDSITAFVIVIVKKRVLLLRIRHIEQIV